MYMTWQGKGPHGLHVFCAASECLLVYAHLGFAQHHLSSPSHDQHALLLCLCRARVKGEADLSAQGLQETGLEPGQQLVIKQVHNVDQEVPRSPAEHEEEVLRSLAGKPFAPQLYGSFQSQEVEAGTGSVCQCVNLIIE